MGGLIYKPIGLVLGIIAGLVGKRLFNVAWTKIDDEDPPKGTTEYAPWAKILGAAALQGVIFKVVRVWSTATARSAGTTSRVFGRARSVRTPRTNDESALPVVGERVLEGAEVAAEQMIDRSGA